MQYLKIQLPKDSLNISKIVLGSDSFGTILPKETAYSLMDAFVEAGGNCIDTARVYAAWLPDGEGASEKTIGAWLKQRNNRARVIISSKGGHPPLGDMQHSRLSRDCIESDLDRSLEALGVDYIDLYWLHRDDINRPVEDIMETMGKIVASGKVRAVGCSNWKVKRIAQANSYAEKNDLPSFSASQIQWSLAKSNPELFKDSTIVCMNDHEYEWYLANNFPVMAFTAQAKGFFAKAASSGINSINQKANARFKSPENEIRLERVIKYAVEKGLTPSSVALGYLLCNSVPAMAIVGCKSLEQLKDTLTAGDVKLDENTIRNLISP